MFRAKHGSRDSLARKDTILRGMGGQRAVASVLNILGLPATLLSPLQAHADAVARASPLLGLVSAGDEGSILERHTADSLIFAMARTPKVGESWVDVGSGGGFPGLVLAVAYPQAVFTLVDSNAKKAGFLELQAIDLGLDNVEVIAGRAGALGAGFDVAVARAVTDPAATLSMLLDRIGLGGTAIVAGAGPAPPGATLVAPDLPFVDSPARLFMMTRTDGRVL